jgi:hypothetical protein
MKNGSKLRTLYCLLSGASVLGSAQAVAQTPTVSLPGDLYTIDIKVVPPLPALPATVIQPFTRSTAEQALSFFNSDTIADVYPGYLGTEFLTATINIRGVPLRLWSSDFGGGRDCVEVSVDEVFAAGVLGPCESGSVGLCARGTIAFDGGVDGRQVAVDRFIAALDDPTSADEIAFAELFHRELVRRSPVDPVAGNPDSLQGRLIRTALDIAKLDVSLERDQYLGPSGSTPWVVGVDGGLESGGIFGGSRASLTAQNGWYLSDNGARLKVDGVLSFAEQENAGQMQGSASLALEYPMMEYPAELGSNWSIKGWTLEPRAAYGLTHAPEAFAVGQMVAGTLTSRLRIDNPYILGDGHLIIGNMVGYTETLDMGFRNFNVDPDIQNTVFRNAIAYQTDLDDQFLGYKPSIRVSLANTALGGDPLFLDNYSEVAFNYGVRNRETTPYDVSDLFRAGVVYTFGQDYSSTQISLGFRF